MRTLAFGLTRWLWWDRGPFARLSRAALLPFGFGYRAAVIGRAWAYRRGWLATRRLPLPAVAVGNLTVGGTGKTPVAAWIAARFAAQGIRPGVLLRGHGRDEHLVHQRLVPGAVVVPNPDRIAGGRQAQAAGAAILVLDDAFQRLDVACDLNVALLAAEQAAASLWPLPAGPWREGLAALRRASFIVITRRRASDNEAAEVARRVARRWGGIPVAVARLRLGHLEGMITGRPAPLATLAGRRVVAAAGVADPGSFAAQLDAHGADVELWGYPDHHAYAPRDVARLVGATGEVEHVVVTEKDAVKLRTSWPADAPEPLVAVLDVEWELNGDVLEAALTALVARVIAS